MCVILVKPSGVLLPEKDKLENCFENNDDGAGFMFCRDSFVHIRKGFMKFTDFYTAYEKENFDRNDVIICHFRVATSGGTCPENTHPFPASSQDEQLRKLKICTNTGVAHNGILGRGEGNLSDTMVMIKTVLADKYILNSISSPGILALLDSHLSTSKVILAFGDGRVYRLGSRDWYLDKGVFYSNTSYREKRVKTYCYTTGTSARELGMYAGYGGWGFNSYDYQQANEKSYTSPVSSFSNLSDNDKKILTYLVSTVLLNAHKYKDVKFTESIIKEIINKDFPGSGIQLSQSDNVVVQSEVKINTEVTEDAAAVKTVVTVLKEDVKEDVKGNLKLLRLDKEDRQKIYHETNGIFTIKNGATCPKCTHPFRVGDVTQYCEECQVDFMNDSYICPKCQEDTHVIPHTQYFCRNCGEYYPEETFKDSTQYI